MKLRFVSSLILCFAVVAFICLPAFGQVYVGSDACKTCHADKYDTWKQSGHPYKFSIIENDQPPTYPDFVTNFKNSWLTNLGDGTQTWADIAGVIGGFGWKSRFVGTDGHIVGTAGSAFSTGLGHNQFNFFGGEDYGWVDYHPGDVKKYNYGCFKCHTTGGDTTGTWLEGVDGLGTFNESGIGCEGCHGPGSAHASSANPQLIDRVYEYVHLDNSVGGLELDGTVITPDPAGDDVNFLCGTCHNRSYTDPINSSGGFIRHHEQWDEFAASKHFAMGFTCVTCHDPHKRVLWDGEGIKTSCAEPCHSEQASKINHVGNATCIDCHMPFAAKSGTTRGQSGYKADVRSHIFAITANTESMFTEDGSAVRDDETRHASLSPAFSCLGCHNDDPADEMADMTIEQAANIAKNMHSEPTGDAEYVGSQTCGSCHAENYANWKDSGHPYKFSIIENDQPPTYPEFVTNFEDSWLANLGDGSQSWGDIAGVIGGFGWKARFVGTDGHIVGTAGSAFSTGLGHNQFNFFGGEDYGWANYHPGDVKKYNYGCFKCHTTGGDTTGTWLEGVDGLGTFTEGGIGCEGCHGPGSHHAQTGGDTRYIDKVYEYAHLDNSIGGLELDGTVITPDPAGNDVNFLCGTCHNRSYTDPINSSGGFIRHHEQWDEFVASDHFEHGLTCVSCHDPHKRVLWDGEGIKMTCETCHSDEAETINHSGTSTCIDCHMPFAAKSGTTRGNSGYKADVRSHIFSIKADTSSMFTADGSAVKDDEEREAALSPRFACLGCHNDSSEDGIPDKTVAEAALAAEGMHEATGVASEYKTAPKDFALFQNFPNPFNPTTTIAFDLKEASVVEITLYNKLGQEIAVMANERLPAGSHKISFSADNLPSGVYLYRITANDFTATKKMVLMK